MINSPTQLMNHFNKLCDAQGFEPRKDVYVKMQKKHNTVKNGLFTDTETMLSCDPSQQMGLMLKKAIRANPRNDNNELLTIQTHHNLEFGTRLFGTWRNTATVYQIDEAIESQALSALIPNETPSEIFKNLPEWAVYMKMPKNSDTHLSLTTVEQNEDKSAGKKVNFNSKMIGFWAMHDNVCHGNDEDQLCLDIYCHLEYPNDAKLHELVLVPIRLILKPNLSIYESFAIGYGDPESIDEIPIRNILSLLLWLCVEEPDVTDIKDKPLTRKELAEPRFARNKKTGVFIPPSKETVLTIAKRMGGEVREWNKQIESAKQQGLPKRRIPHIRRGHWNGVWTGSGDNKVYKTYWQKPIFVNASFSAD